jgi:putative autoinducer-2 (AI-2) aldolase
MLTRGVLRTCVDAGTDTPMVLRVSGGNSIIGKDLSDEEITVAMEDAVRLNVSAVALSIYVGAEHEHQTLLALSRLVDEGSSCGMPVLAVTAVGKELEKRDARYLSLACRIAAELGAHFVKTYYCDDFEKMDALKIAHEAVAAGATGVDMGRNIWQSPDPVGMIKAIRAIVHEKATAKEAAKFLASSGKR